MPTGTSVHYVSAATGAAGHRPLPLADPTKPQRAAHTPKPRKPAGLDWDAITPLCRSCNQKSGALNFEDLCPSCAAPGTANDPTRLMRKTRPGECIECGRESRFLHDGECPVCRGETTELVLADHPEPAKPPSANVASPAAQSSPAHTPDLGERAAMILAATEGTHDTVVALLRRSVIAALEALWLHHNNQAPAPAPTSQETAAAEEAKPAERNEPDRPSRPTRAATIDRALDDTQLQTIADAYHHDLVSIGDLATQHQLTNARIRHIITRAGYPIRGRGDLNQRITQQLLDLGLTSHDVKTWALEEGLVDKMSRGTIAPALLTAYVAAHQPDTTKELSS